MRMAARIRQIRLERWVSLERLEAHTGLAKSLLARLEKGQEVPTLETLDSLADALGVPVHRFFYNDGEPPLTPRLTPRLAWKELTETCHGQASSVLLSKPKRWVLATIKALIALAARALTLDRRLVSLRSHSTNHQRDAQGGTLRGPEVPERVGTP
jgi:transcriptional regulator with XRE-family HTH domain